MKKGEFGYLQKKRTVSILKSALFLAAVLVIYFAALHHFHTNKNVFSILAAVGALPTARSIVESIMCVRARSASAAVRDAVAEIDGLPQDTSGFDLYLTAYERAFSLSHVTVADHRVLGLTEDPGTDTKLCEDHIRQTLLNDGIGEIRVAILDDLSAYVGELKDLSGSARTGTQETQETDRRIYRLLLAVSL